MDAKDFCQSIWLVTNHDLFRVTLINAVGVILVFGMWWWQIRRMILPKSFPVRLDVLVRVMVVFYLIGLPARCLVILDEMNLISSFTVPGSLHWVAYFTSAGMIFLTLLALRRGNAWWLLWVGLLAVDVTAAALSFSKGAIISSLMPCLFGYMLYQPGTRSVRWIPVFFVVTYLASNSFVTYCRDKGMGNESIHERLNITGAYINSKQQKEQTKTQLETTEISQRWWFRLNYANAETFAMHEYDEGRPGDSFTMLLIAPIPRILWHNKPVIEPGAGFYSKLSGEKGASFSVGFFLEAYWNGGWLYVILVSIVIGWLLGGVTLFIANKLSAGNLWVFPIALLWIKSGGQVAGWILSEIVGPSVFTIIYIGLMRYFSLGKSMEAKTNRGQAGWSSRKSNTRTATNREIDR